MQRFRVRLVTIAVLTVLSAAQVHAAQVCRTDVPSTAPDSRYQDNLDGTVTDLITGLIWKQCAEGLSGATCTSGSASSFTWQQALQQAADALSPGSTPWRVPNRNELASLAEQSCFGPAINTGLFPNTESTQFWSSSPETDDPFRAWGVGFNNGTVVFLNKNQSYRLRLVRDAE